MRVRVGGQEVERTLPRTVVGIVEPRRNYKVPAEALKVYAQRILATAPLKVALVAGHLHLALHPLLLRRLRDQLQERFLRMRK